jgi:hypothetical protein
MTTNDNQPVGECQHCGVGIFNNPDADSALDAMAHLCWRCVKPHGVAQLTRVAYYARKANENRDNWTGDYFDGMRRASVAR